MSPDAYMAVSEEVLLSAIDKQKVSKQARFIHDQFRSLILHPQFPCPGAKTAFSRGTYRMGVFEKMADTSSTQLLGQALAAFVAERESMDREFTTFIASFKEKVMPTADCGFTELLWNQLQLLHEIDQSEWDPKVSSDPEAANFSFSFGGCAFFVIGIHSESWRYARRFGWPTLVFNAHDQFERLRARGEFQQFRDTVRKRDVALQGCSNPILEDHGLSSEARQYSGEQLSQEWKCPFHCKR